MWRQCSITIGRISRACLLGLFSAASLQAQVGVGDNVNMTLNGNLAFGYSGEYSDNSPSSHGLFGSGSGLLSGSYYNPNFLSFNVRPFYNRNQDNGSFTSILSDTGVDASVNLFSGSRFPGMVSYSKVFANGSQFGLPGSLGLSSDSSTRNVAVSWSELLPDLPNVSFTFADSASSSTIQGQGGATDTSSRTFNLMSHYRIDGFGLQGFVNHQNFDVTLPEFLSPTNAKSISAGTSYGISAEHTLPVHGSFTASYNRTDFSSATGAYHNSGTTDTADAMVAFQPTQRFAFNSEVRYTGNLYAALQQSLLPSGTPPLPVLSEQTSRGVSLNTLGTYNLGHGFILLGFVNQQIQTFADRDFTSTRAGGTLTYSYSRPLFGVLYLGFGMVNNASNNGGGNVGFVGNASFSKKFGPWQVDGDFSYSQNAQTIIAYYTSSNYSYGGMTRRRFGANTYWSTSYRGMRSGLTQLPGYSNRSNTFLSVFSRGRYGFSGTYSKSHGTALLSAAGVITPTPLAPMIAPDQALYDGTVYGAGVNVVPLKRMVVNFNWYRTRSDTQTATIFSANNSERYYGQMQYNLRKLSFRAGYWRVYQGISADGRPPSTVNTYFFSISRWFNVF